MKNSALLFLFLFTASLMLAQKKTAKKPRVLISTDIGGTDPDDNQSMAHLLMYSDRVNIAGLVSSPSYGEGSTQEIFRMIDLYEKDLPKLAKHSKGFAQPEYLRQRVKQGQKGTAPYKGYRAATEGSNWIIKCAGQKKEPLWVLVWGGLEDVAQALHDAPEIAPKLKVYWIGGPNKKWSANAYAYIVANFPDLWFIEVNASYYGFFSDNTAIDTIRPTDYYNKHIKGAGHLGADFKNYYGGEIKMGDTPSLLYVLNGDPENPTTESWGGSFAPITHSPRKIYTAPTTVKDSIPFCGIMEFNLKGPEQAMEPGTVCFKMVVPYGKSQQIWPGYYMGNGQYQLRYIPKKAETLNYYFTSDIDALNGLKGSIVVTNKWPGDQLKTSYPLGKTWFTDKPEAQFYDGKLQGGKTIGKWRTAVMEDWAKRWAWLKE